MGTWPIITWLTRPVPISAADWAERPRPANPTNGLWPWQSRSPNAVSFTNGFGNWGNKNSAPDVDLRGPRTTIEQTGRFEGCPDTLIPLQIRKEPNMRFMVIVK